jgi:hypothetical protein
MATLHHHIITESYLLSKVGYSATSIFNVFHTLLVDLYPNHTASIAASNNIARCLLGYVLHVLFLQQIMSFWLSGFEILQSGGHCSNWTRYWRYRSTVHVFDPKSHFDVVHCTDLRDWKVWTSVETAPWVPTSGSECLIKSEKRAFYELTFGIGMGFSMLNEIWSIKSTSWFVSLR